MDVYRERIKPLFDASGLSVQEIADATGIKVKTIYNWNQGLSKSYTKFIPQIAAFLNVSADYLSGTGDNEKAAPEGGVESQEVREWSAAWDRASPEARAAALAVLRLGARRPEDQDEIASGR